MPSKIRVLDDLTINKIAAGEVIENPASVVKELIENCLDAGASEITVEAQAGGRHLIRISDNGIGMGRDDALLAFERHATSKLKHIDDLTTLTSLGFRGEAVPSIASISKFSVITKEQNEASPGTFVRVEGGKMLAVSDTERTPGTTIEVKDLFYNLPVRKKFLKSPAADETAILKGVMEQAIARPDLKLQLILNQKSVLLVHPEEPKDRIASVLGEALRKELLPLSGIEIQGYIGTPESARPSRSMQYLFLNGRPIQSPFISWAIKEAYSTHLPARRFPIFILWLTLLPEMVDVNVHPQKREVRFRDEASLQGLIYKAVHQSLSQNKEAFSFYTPPSPQTEKSSLDPFSPIAVMQPPAWRYEASSSPLSNAPDFENNTFPAKELPLTFTSQEPKKMQARVAATLKGYILAEIPGKEGLQLIDQQRAHARVIFERLEKKKTDKLEKTMLLLPYTFELSKLDAKLLLEYLPELENMGFEIREFGPQSFAIEAYPSFYKEPALDQIIHPFLDEIRSFSSNRSTKTKLKEQLAEKSAQLSVRSSKVLTHEEAERLIEDLWDCDRPHESPSGKSTVVHLDGEILSRHFSNEK